MENIVLKGRYLKRGSEIQFYNTGSGVSIYFQGEKITFKLAPIFRPCYIYVIKDHNYDKKEKFLIADEQDLDVTLQDNNPHFIDIVKANEATDNGLMLKDIKFFGKTLEFPEKPRKFVKVYGDSTIAGYGILAHEGVANIHTNDGVEDFCFRALYNLGYDYDIFCASGWGVTFSMYTDPKEVGIEKFLDCVCVNSNEKWVSKKADLLIISLGTNDMSFINENKDKEEQLIRKFISSYKGLIEKERKNNPDLPVLMVYGTVKEVQAYGLVERTYAEISKVLDNLYIVKLDGDNTAIAFHSYLTSHKKMSEDLAKKIISIIR